MTVSPFRFPCDLSKERADLLHKVSHTHLAHKTTAGTRYASVETTHRRYIASSYALTNTSSESQDFEKCSWDNKYRSTKYYCFTSDEDLLMLSPFPITTWLGFLTKLHSRSRRNIPGDGHCHLTSASPGCSLTLPSRCCSSAQLWFQKPKGRVFFGWLFVFLLKLFYFLFICSF